MSSVPQQSNTESQTLQNELDIKRFGVHRPHDVVMNQTAGKNNQRFNVSAGGDG